MNETPRFQGVPESIAPIIWFLGQFAILGRHIKLWHKLAPLLFTTLGLARVRFQVRVFPDRCGREPRPRPRLSRPRSCAARDNAGALRDLL